VASDKRVMDEVTMKEAADKEPTDKRAAECSSAFDWVPSSSVGAKRAAMPSGSTPSAK
jgi:hypothetical protein